MSAALTPASSNGSLAAIFGLSGLRLTADERDFLSEAAPWGLILFARNIEAPDQVRALVDEAREVLGRRAPVLIDQEGGRVARLSPPHWRSWPAPLEDAEAADGAERLRLRYRLIAGELAALGIDVNCAPMIDVAGTQAHSIVTSRILGWSAGDVAARGRIVAEALLDGGVLPVIKHIPGHGRADVDSHLALPRVHASSDQLSETDFAPFRMLADLPLAMTAHITFDAVDPARPATLSRLCTTLIREDIGFDGVLMTDDLGMAALQGSMRWRAEAAIDAGCDIVLHCSGVLGEMVEVAEGTPLLTGTSLARTRRAEARRCPPDGADLGALAARYDALQAEAAA